MRRNGRDQRKVTVKAGRNSKGFDAADIKEYVGIL